MSQLSASQARLRQQQLEQAAFDVVRRQSAALADHLERLADNVDGLRDNADVVASVVEHWQDCFRATHLAVGPSSIILLCADPASVAR